MMTGEDILRILGALRESGIPPSVDGGWGIDALLGEQTRAHEDLDRLIGLEHALCAARALASSGGALAEDELPARLVLDNPGGRRIDVNTASFNAAGAGWQRLQDGLRFRYPPGGFTSGGAVAGEPVQCLSPSGWPATWDTSLTKPTAATSPRSALAYR